MQDIKEEVEPNPYTMHGNPFFDAANASTVLGPGAMGPSVSVHRLSFEPSSLGVGRTLASAVASAAALGAFERSAPVSPNGNSQSHSQHGAHAARAALLPHGAHGSSDAPKASSSGRVRSDGGGSQNPSVRSSVQAGVVRGAMDKLLRCAPCVQSQHATYSPRIIGSPAQRMHACTDRHTHERGNILVKHAQHAWPQGGAPAGHTAHFGAQQIAVPVALRSENDEAPLLTSNSGGAMAQARTQQSAQHSMSSTLGGYLKQARAAVGRHRGSRAR